MISKNDQIEELLKAQDVLRRFYARQTQLEFNDYLRRFDRFLTKTINNLGKKA